MRKSLLTLLLVVFFKFADAQAWVYHPFPTGNAVWTNANGTWDVQPTVPPSAILYMNAPTRYCMTTDDTLIGTNTFSKLYYCGGAYRGGLRDNGAGKVYFVPADSSSELLIYDFTVSAGSTVTVYETMGNSLGFTPYTYSIGTHDSTMINGSFRKRVYVNGEYWIEGIGCTNGLFTESWPNVSNWYVDLECMSDADTTLYPIASIGPCNLYSGITEAPAMEDVNVYPNPSSGVYQIYTNLQTRSVEVIDLLGNVLFTNNVQSKITEIDISNEAPGIYFVILKDLQGKTLTKKLVKQ